MQKRKLLLLAVAGLVAIVTVVVARSMMQSAPQEAQAPAPTNEVIAAARDLPTGTILKDMDLKWVTWPASADTSQLYVKGKTEMSAVVGGVLRESLRADEPLPPGHVVQAHEHGFLAAVLASGKRAVAVTLTPSGEVAGFIFPGDHVDVLLTHRFTAKNDKGENETIERSVSETVVTDARVLALDQKTDDQSTDPKVAQLATLEVTPKQAEQLTLAIDMAGTTGTGHGSISLVLRSLATDETATPPAAVATVPAAGSSGAAAPVLQTPVVQTITPIPKPVPPVVNTMDRTPTLDSDISTVLPRYAVQQKVHVMRGKDTTDNFFQSQK